MTREDEILKEAELCASANTQIIGDWGEHYLGFIHGAEWADSHPHWISVEDELPKDREMVLALGKFDAYFVACYDYLIESWFDENDTFIREDWSIAYWMPLPQAPKEGE